MAYDKGKTEHTGAKNGGGGMWGHREDVKQASRKRRRRANRLLTHEQVGERLRKS